MTLPNCLFSLSTSQCMHHLLIMAQTRPLFRLFSSFSHPKLHINWKSLDVVLRIFVGLFFRYLAHFFAFGQIFIIVNGRKLNIWSHWLQSLWSGLPNERVRFYLFQVWSSFTLSTFVRSFVKSFEAIMRRWCENDYLLSLLTNQAWLIKLKKIFEISNIFCKDFLIHLALNMGHSLGYQIQQLVKA